MAITFGTKMLVFVSRTSSARIFVSSKPRDWEVLPFRASVALGFCRGCELPAGALWPACDRTYAVHTPDGASFHTGTPDEADEWILALGQAQSLAVRFFELGGRGQPTWTRGRMLATCMCVLLDVRLDGHSSVIVWCTSGEILTFDLTFERQRAGLTITILCVDSVSLFCCQPLRSSLQHARVQPCAIFELQRAGSSCSRFPAQMPPPLCPDSVTVHAYIL